MRAAGTFRERLPADPPAENGAVFSAHLAENSLADLIIRGVFAKDAAGGRSTSYSLVVPEGSDH